MAVNENKELPPRIYARTFQFVRPFNSQLGNSNALISTLKDDQKAGRKFKLTKKRAKVVVKRKSCCQARFQIEKPPIFYGS